MPGSDERGEIPTTEPSSRDDLGLGARADTPTERSVAGSSSEGTINPEDEEGQTKDALDWLPTAPGGVRPAGTHSTDVNHHVEGYPSRTSVVPGDSLDFHVSTAPAARYRIDVYRLGWYDGDGARKMTSLSEKQGERRPIPDWDEETGLIECEWPVTDTLDVPTQWPSGTYIAHFVATSGEYEGESTGYVFAVRERPDRERSSRIVAQLPLATSQAYNGWGGKSLYDSSSATDRERTETGGQTADVVSYDRPIGGAPTFHMRYAIHAVRFLEQNGYDVSYVTDVDVHRDPALLQDHELVLSLGHDEYWSAAQRAGFEAARDSGTDIAFLAANAALWQVRFEDSETPEESPADGRAVSDGRIMVSYKENVEDDPLHGTRLETDRFRDLEPPHPECELLGVMGIGAGLYKGPDLTVVEEALDHPWFDDTGFEAGDEIVGVVAHEWDYIREDCDVPSELTTFFHYESGTSEYDSIFDDADADSVAYEAPSGARVFSCGTLGFTWPLDPDPSWDRAWPIRPIAEGEAEPAKPAVLEPDLRVQQFVKNVVDDLRKSSPPESENSGDD